MRRNNWIRINGRARTNCSTKYSNILLSIRAHNTQLISKWFTKMSVERMFKKCSCVLWIPLGMRWLTMYTSTGWRYTAWDALAAWLNWCCTFSCFQIIPDAIDSVDLGRMFWFPGSVVDNSRELHNKLIWKSRMRWEKKRTENKYTNQMNKNHVN